MDSSKIYEQKKKYYRNATNLIGDNFGIKIHIQVREMITKFSPNNVGAIIFSLNEFMTKFIRSKGR